ncbi:helix-turn-helix domain-containing protein [Micromonospora radicis]|uniref:helix-turn-helix domain-containing protein n=1 Tax=Micromonospora radicis TaxID=1894971 RepID=UPI001F31AC8C
MSLLRRVIGAVLRRERQRQGRTLREVAQAAGVSVPYLSEVERGRKEASSEVLAAVCRALDLYLSDLLEAVRDELRRVERRIPSAPRNGHLSAPRHAGSPVIPPRPAAGGARHPVARLGGARAATGLPTDGLGGVGLGVPVGRVTPAGAVTGGLRIVVFDDLPARFDGPSGSQPVHRVTGFAAPDARLVARSPLPRAASGGRSAMSAVRRPRRPRPAGIARVTHPPRDLARD